MVDNKDPKVINFKQPINPHQAMPIKVRESALPEISLDVASKLPVNRQLVGALRGAIHRGLLKVGSRLPPSREAAMQLGVGRNTVVDAYADLLAEGLIETQGRLGSFVASKLASSTVKKVLKSELPHVSLRLSDVQIQRATQDWRLGQARAQLLPLHVWRAACKESGRHLPPSDYGDPRGSRGLRQAIADWLRNERSVFYSPDQIVVTQGAGSAIDLLMALLLRSGDVCAVEQPGYLRAPTAARAAGASVREVAVDQQGMRIEDAFQGKAPALLHLTPSHQYPLGVRLSGARRKQLVQLVLRHRSIIIENEYDHEFIHEGQNHAPLAASLPEHSVLVSTFAKAISPSLRLGFVAAPIQIADALVAKIERERLHVSWPVQCSVQWLLHSGHLQRHLRRVRRHYAQLRQQLLGQLHLRCAELQIGGLTGGLHVVLRASTQTRTIKVVNALRQRGIALQELNDFGSQESAFLLGYGHMTSDSIEDCIKAIEGAMPVAQLKPQQ